MKNSTGLLRLPPNYGGTKKSNRLQQGRLCNQTSTGQLSAQHLHAVANLSDLLNRCAVQPRFAQTIATQVGLGSQLPVGVENCCFFADQASRIREGWCRVRPSIEAAPWRSFGRQFQ